MLLNVRKLAFEKSPDIHRVYSCIAWNRGKLDAKNNLIQRRVREVRQVIWARHLFHLSTTFNQHNFRD